MLALQELRQGFELRLRVRLFWFGFKALVLSFIGSAEGFGSKLSCAMYAVVLTMDARVTVSTVVTELGRNQGK